MPVHAILDVDGHVPPEELGSGTPTGTKFLRDDGSWQEPLIENRTSDPPSPATGQIWLRTDL